MISISWRSILFVFLPSAAGYFLSYFFRTINALIALNVFHIGGAFLLQEAMGWVIDRWPEHGGHYPPLAYKTALALIVILQDFALIWFARLHQLLPVTILRRLQPLHKEIA